jgi:hypothetical protein
MVATDAYADPGSERAAGGATLDVTHHLLTGVHIANAKEMAHVLNSGIQASHGVIHFIDKVILPWHRAAGWLGPGMPSHLAAAGIGSSEIVAAWPRRYLSRNCFVRTCTSGLRKPPCPPPGIVSTRHSTPALSQAASSRVDWL